MSAVIRIEPVRLDPERHGGRKTAWQWRCDCHGVVSVLPWAERPSDAAARAEHDFVVRDRPAAAQGAWLPLGWTR